MIKHWQSMQNYKCFLHNSKVSFDSSERTRLHTELWIPWQKLRLFNNRILNDYGLHRMMIHTKKHYSFMTTMIGICIHLDARYKQQQTV